MSKKHKVSAKLHAWIDARKKYHLSHAHVQLVRELGLNPHKLGKIANTKQEPWKTPLPDFIEELYLKRFGKLRLDVIKRIEQRGTEQQGKKSNPAGREQ